MVSKWKSPSSTMMVFQITSCPLLIMSITKDGGTHETGLKSAITKVMNDYARKTGLLKEKIKILKVQTIVRDLLPSFLSLVPEEHLQFEGQTKDKLEAH